MGKQGRKGKKRKFAEKLYELLRNDIIKRYNKTIESSIPRKLRDREILMKYNFQDNWNTRISMKFQKDNELTDDQINEITKLILQELIDY